MLAVANLCSRQGHPCRRAVPLLPTLLITSLLCWMSLAHQSAYADDELIQVTITDAYLDMHTGPGRGYPVFHVAEKDDIITLLKVRTDWVKVVTRKGHEGWIKRDDMVYTLGLAGETVDFSRPGRTDYNRRRWEMGFSAGDFEGADSLGVHVGYRLSNNLMAEARLGQATGSFSNSRFGSLGIMNQPFPHWRVSPFFTLGAGKITVSPNASLISTTDRDDNFLLAGTGAYIYASRRFMFRLEYNSYTILTSRDENEEIDEWKLGFSVFF